ncbi:sigma-70 family RNA polymerase sigma factor [Pandoraea pneumonica]|uniref:Sigma-70 family RNA polymerase sigma factor n=1 Tax=Pandoraea pneumonica TaxID=2508299 RepID=A0A5E4VWU9_9BURK|nr:sigma-70 family RNA polymerase sigma factor [Pandoraea pneumonica]VVE15510.1 sigma-70 family RNA polymerase sigma factor [Pandoraea pneumonica]
MKRDDIENEELTRLLRKFGQPGDGSAAVKMAHREFYNRMAGALDRQALQATGFNDDLARQTVQEAWCRIVTGAQDYDPSRASVKTWVNMITRYCALDVLRVYYKHSRFTDDGAKLPDDMSGNMAGDVPVDDPDDIACEWPSAADGIYGDQIQRAVRKCLEALPAGKNPNYRLAMELALDEDLSYADMTVELQRTLPPDVFINAEQVRGWVKKARERMRGCVSRKLGMTSASTGKTGASKEMGE